MMRVRSARRYLDRLEYADMDMYHVHMSNPPTNVLIAAAHFKADCLKVIDQMSRDHRPVTITKRGRPVATLSPIASSLPKSIIGALKGAVLRYDDPFAPVAPASDWDASS